VCLHEGKGVRRNDRECVRWYRRAVAAGDHRAMHNLARCYRAGHGVPKSGKKVVEWLARSAATSENPVALAELAQIHLDGDGVAKDARKAVAWARRLLRETKEKEAWFARLGAPIDFGDTEAVCRAHHILGECAEDGKGMRKDLRAAFRHYRAGAKNHACAAFDLAEAYEGGLGVACDPRAARRWFRHAARLGDDRAKKRLRSRRRSRR
jgi:TPR repeat protein